MFTFSSALLCITVIQTAKVLKTFFEGEPDEPVLSVSFYVTVEQSFVLVYLLFIFVTLSNIWLIYNTWLLIEST